MIAWAPVERHIFFFKKKLPPMVDRLVDAPSRLVEGHREGLLPIVAPRRVQLIVKNSISLI